MAVFTIPTIKQIEREKEEIFSKMTPEAISTDYSLLLGGIRGYYYKPGRNTTGYYWINDEDIKNPKGYYCEDYAHYEEIIEKSSYDIG